MNKQGRNKLCDCGSGKKYKVCHGRIDKGLNQQWMIIFAIGAIFLIFFFVLSDSNSTNTTNTNIAPLPRMPSTVGNAGLPNFSTGGKYVPPQNGNKSGVKNIVKWDGTNYDIITLQEIWSKK